MKLTLLSLAIFLLPASMHSSIYAEDNKTLNPYTNGWFYLPGIDRDITECLVIELEDGEVAETTEADLIDEAASSEESDKEESSEET